MRIAAIGYIVLSIGANFFIGNLTTFVLAAFSFPVLLWVLAKKSVPKNRTPQNREATINTPGVS